MTLNDTESDDTEHIGDNGTRVSNAYGGVYRLERDGQGQFKLTAEEIIELYHYITTGSECTTKGDMPAKGDQDE